MTTDKRKTAATLLEHAEALQERVFELERELAAATEQLDAERKARENADRELIYAFNNWMAARKEGGR